MSAEGKRLRTHLEGRLDLMSHEDGAEGIARTLRGHLEKRELEILEAALNLREETGLGLMNPSYRAFIQDAARMAIRLAEARTETGTEAKTETAP